MVLIVSIERGLKRRYATTRLLRLGVRILPGAWMFLCCECCVLSSTGSVKDRSLVRSPTDCGASLCDLETSRMRKLWPALGRSATAYPAIFIIRESAV